MSAPIEIFRVIANDDHGQPVSCSYCSRGANRVVVLPVADHPALGACAYCVLDMAKALQAAEAKR